MRKPSLPLLPLLFLPLLLAGCMSAPIARQIASSAFTRTADHVTGQVIDAREQREREQSRALTFKDSVSDEYWGIFARAQFQDVPPPQPKEAEQPATPSTTASRLVPVETWGFLVGQEKTSVLERMRRNGSETVPSREEWDRWQLATGGLQGKTGAPLYFLVPPDFGRLTSGDHAIVEISGIGGLHVARHRAGDH